MRKLDLDVTGEGTQAVCESIHYGESQPGAHILVGPRRLFQGASVPVRQNSNWSLVVWALVYDPLWIEFRIQEELKTRE